MALASSGMLWVIENRGHVVDAADTRDLIALRFMLEDALLRVSTAHRYSRGSAVVALDAAVERAAYLVVLRRGINVNQRDSLGDLHSKLVQKLEATWTPTMWAQVRHLHAARNGAQHRGQTPAAEDVSAWAAAARAYVTSLVSAEYDVDLDRLVLADAVRRNALAELVRTAETSLVAGDVPSSVQASKDAFEAAVGMWSRMHARSRRRFRATYHPAFAVPDSAEQAIEILERASAERSFASSAAEYAWFTAACRDRVELLDADDAERILAFTFGWIVSFELAADQWTPNRRRRADVAARRVRTTADHASILGIRRVKREPPFTNVTFELADVPAIDSYDAWADALAKFLREAESRRWRVGDDGTVTLVVHSGAVPSGDDVNALVQALANVDEAMAAEKLHQAEEDARLRNERAERNREVSALATSLPAWVEKIEFENQGRSYGNGWLIWVESSVEKLRFPNTGQLPEWLNVWGVLRESELPNVFAQQDRACVPLPANAADVVKALREIDALVLERLKETAEDERVRRDEVAAIQAELASALALAQHDGAAPQA